MMPVPDAPEGVPLRFSKGLAPLVRPDAEILILGSLPGRVSLQREQYYGHPANQFWRLIGDVFGLRFAQCDYAEKIHLLNENRIGLWDSIEAAVRHSSLDSDIRHPRLNSISALAESLPRLRIIGFNGKVAARFALLTADIGAQQVHLPSSSPANTTPYAVKLAAWKKLKERA